MSVLSPNMNLVIPQIGVDSGLIWEQSVNANTLTLDQHNHAAGSGVKIDPSGININADLTYNDLNAINLRSIRYFPQGAVLSGPSDLGCTYVSGVDLYYNDVNGNSIRMTAGGSVNATSSGIVSGTATASFVGSTLVVDSAVNTPANIQGASILIGNTGVANSKYVTLSAQNSLASNYNLFLPLLPAANDTFVTIGTSGVMSSTYTVDNSTIGLSGGNIIVKPSGITTTQIADHNVTQAKLQLRTLSVAAPPGGVAISFSSGAYTTNATTYVSINNLNCNLTTTGRPVVLRFASAANQGCVVLSGIDAGVPPVGVVTYALLRFENQNGGLSVVEEMQVGSASDYSPYPGGKTLYYPPNCFAAIDFPPAGTQLYNVSILVSDASITAGVSNIKLIAYEI